MRPNSRNAGTVSARPAGRSWRVDETYVKIKGRWTYLYRAVDKEGRTVDFLLRAKRDVAAAKAFFRLAFRRQGRLPLKITLDGYQASHRAGQRGPGRTSRGNQCRKDQIVKIFEQFDRTGSSIRQASGSVRCSASSISAKPQRRSPASNSCIGSGRVSSNSVDRAPRATWLPRFGMRFSLRDPTQLPGACLARPQNVCTTTRQTGRDGVQLKALKPRRKLLRHIINIEQSASPVPSRAGS